MILPQANDRIRAQWSLFHAERIAKMDLQDYAIKIIFNIIRILNKTKFYVGVQNFEPLHKILDPYAGF
jgi:hypothetical protein